MKRVICILAACALLLPVLLIPASAAEEYVFEWVNPEAIMLDDSFDFLPSDDDCFFCYAGAVPEGMYTLTLNCDSVDIFAEVLDPVTVLYDDNVDFYDCLVSICTVDVTFVDLSGSMTFPCDIYVILYGDFTLLGLSDPGYSDFFPVIDMFYSVVLTPIVPPVPNAADSLSKFLTVFVDGLSDYNTANLSTWIISGLGVAAAPALCWFGYRIIKRRRMGAFFKGKF